MTTAETTSNPTTQAPFGTVFTDTMAVVSGTAAGWGEPALVPVGPLSLHPGTHALHYGSACFEGLKAHRGADGTVRIFRLERHVERLLASAAVLHLPCPPADVVTDVIVALVADNLAAVPDAPGSLYLRPTLFGTDPNIGAAASPSTSAQLVVLASPVGDYFAGGIRPLRLAVETGLPRTTPQFGMVKSGANYAMALAPTLAARAALDVDQVLFAPGGVVQETGAANILILDGERLITPALSEAFLHGVTRDSLLTIAAADGYTIDERPALTVDELLALASRPGADAGTFRGAAGEEGPEIRQA